MKGFFQGQLQVPQQRALNTLRAQLLKVDILAGTLLLMGQNQRAQQTRIPRERVRMPVLDNLGPPGSLFVLVQQRLPSGRDVKGSKALMQLLSGSLHSFARTKNAKWKQFNSSQDSSLLSWRESGRKRNVIWQKTMRRLALQQLVKDQIAGLVALKAQKNNSTTLRSTNYTRSSPGRRTYSECSRMGPTPTLTLLLFLVALRKVERKASLESRPS